MLIADLLQRGEENGVKMNELKGLTGMRNRELRRKIELERRAGTPILSSCKTGYFLPGTDDERVRCVRSLRHRAGEILRTAAAIEKGFIEVHD